MKEFQLISIDIAKNVFQICALNSHNKVEFNKKVSRSKLLSTLREFQPTTVVMEACYSAHPWGRAIQKLGHEAKLIPAFQVKPFVVGNKNDYNDAIAIAEAANRPKVKFVPIKTIEQQDIQSLQRIRERLLRSRTATSNQLRGLISEYGIIVPKSLQALRTEVPVILENKDEILNAVELRFIRRLYDEILWIDQQVSELVNEMMALLETREDFQLLQSVPRIGPAVAASVISSVNDTGYFKNAKQFAAWIGLTPKQHASGESSRHLGMSKRGNQTLRRLFIHGARAVLNWCEKKNDHLNLWIKALKARNHPCKVIVALANKIARIAWAVLANKRPYQKDYIKCTTELNRINSPTDNRYYSDELKSFSLPKPETGQRL